MRFIALFLCIAAAYSQDLSSIMEDYNTEIESAQQVYDLIVKNAKEKALKELDDQEKLAMSNKDKKTFLQIQSMKKKIQKVGVEFNISGLWFVRIKRNPTLYYFKTTSDDKGIFWRQGSEWECDWKIENGWLIFTTKLDEFRFRLVSESGVYSGFQKKAAAKLSKTDPGSF
jgi:hypothetical protein